MQLTVVAMWLRFLARRKVSVRQVSVDWCPKFAIRKQNEIRWKYFNDLYLSKNTAVSFSSWSTSAEADDCWKYSLCGFLFFIEN